MVKILFFNPPSRAQIYLNTNVSVGAPSYPNLTFATLAGHLIGKYDVRIIDLDFSINPKIDLTKELVDFCPDVVATSVKTPDYFIVWDLMQEVKKINPRIKTVIGGVHVTACPKEFVDDACFDIMVIGEGDKTLIDLLSSSSLEDVAGIIYRQISSSEFIFNKRRPLVEDLNEMPYPDWRLFDLKRYKNSRLTSRLNPVGHIETSRGCIGECNFCNKLTFGSRNRVKNPKRVVDEMEYMLCCGFREIHIADDSFTQNIQRAKEVCEEILRRGLKFSWALSNGVRVDMVDFEFFSLAKKAGCWQVGFGIETGDQDVLDKINKGTTIHQIKSAVVLAKRADLDTFGFFIFGLSGETENSMCRTIEFAKKLPLDIAKFDICIPYPGTRYYNELRKEGRIISRDWSKYSCHQIDEPLFEHPVLSWDVLVKYYRRAFLEFYFRPIYLWGRFIRSLKMNDLISDFFYLLKAKW